ncbi:MAG: 3-deoxy-7-phosphoheptulonate synthase, partial [Bradyrhizobium sp.]|nr:3-deoxy-7-phosphoheptulonate synthase [Bradyrhizobium sp.]
NYDAAHVEQAASELVKAGLPARLMIDTSHANSSKKPENQPLVAADIAGQLAAGEQRIMGVMIESHLVAGRQDVKPGVPLTYGQSITDGCIGWDTTVAVLEQLADAVTTRRTRRNESVRERSA